MARTLVARENEGQARRSVHLTFVTCFSVPLLCVMPMWRAPARRMWAYHYDCVTEGVNERPHPADRDGVSANGTRRCLLPHQVLLLWCYRRIAVVGFSSMLRPSGSFVFRSRDSCVLAEEGG